MNIRGKLAGIVVASATIAVVVTVPGTAFAGGSSVPFSDPNQVGTLTLCNQHEQPITSGSLLSIPFVWTAVSSNAAPAGYTRATLYVYQPIEYVDPGDWTGYQLTDDALFSNRAHPMAQATYADAPLLWPDHSIPPHWNGLYQLRMIFSSPDQQPVTSSYPAAVIHVTGNTWTLVQGGGSTCGDGKAVSVESSILPKSETAVPKPPETQVPYADRTKTTVASTGSTSPASPGGSSATTSTTTTVGRSGSSGGSAPSALAGQAGRSSSGGGPSDGALVGGLIAAWVVVGTAGLLIVRRRRRAA